MGKVNFSSSSTGDKSGKIHVGERKSRANFEWDRRKVGQTSNGTEEKSGAWHVRLWSVNLL